MKKWKAFLLTGLMVTSLAGCGSGNTANMETTVKQESTGVSSSEKQSGQDTKTENQEPTVVRMSLGSEPTALTPGSLPHQIQMLFSEMYLKD